MSQGTPSFRARARYRFDNLMSRGVGIQILMLAAITAALIFFVLLLLKITGLGPEGNAESTGATLWSGLMHAIDGGTIAGDPGPWGFRAIMLITTLGGIFVLSALISILSGGFQALLDSLRKGRSRVVEKRHTVILGYSSRIHALLSELAAANANVRNACVVVLAPTDKVTMDDEIREQLGKKRMRVVTRSGSPLVADDLELVNLDAAKSVIVLSPDGDEQPDISVLKTLMAIAKAASNLREPPHVVAELQDAATMNVAKMVLPSASLVLAPPLIGRLLVQTGRQSGLSEVYTELLDFGGDEIYMKQEPGLTGRPFRDVMTAFDTSAVLGVVDAEGRVMLPPALDRPMGAGDRVVVISEDDDTVVLDGKPTPPVREAIAPIVDAPAAKPERTLILGVCDKLPLVLRELDHYVGPGSQTIVLGSQVAAAAELDDVVDKLAHMKVEVRSGDMTDRDVLDGLDVPSFDHVLLLAETDDLPAAKADAHTMVALLHLRDILLRAGVDVPITTEMLSAENRELASVAEVDDFIVSNALVSLMITQIAENKLLAAVFDDLFSSEGAELYLKPAERYVRPGVELDFYTVIDSAAQRGEIALGYRIAALSKDASAGFGVKCNPRKSERVRFAAGDKVIVLAQ
jgi:voltage-gated potassium channel Kch